ncbi:MULTISPECIES: hypothetical protein [Streptomonospora]|uniref:Toxin-antitoxin system HicB family antitoxin n=2 Tax=Streptomonospora TaxID=104204 RepID=A0ABV9SR86_9ACTN
MAERKRILLRLDPAVHDALARWAGDELRSTNAQIEFLLRRALSAEGRLPGGAGAIPRRGRPRASPAPQEQEEDAGGDGDGEGREGGGADGGPPG